MLNRRPAEPPSQQMSGRASKPTCHATPQPCDAPAAKCSGVLFALSRASTGQPAATSGASTCVCPKAAP